jgi:O-antigen ligase
LIFLGGYRSSIVAALIILGMIFWMEKMYRTGAMVAMVMVTILGGALLVPLASHLPYTFQRALAFLPLDINPEARMDAEASTDWRLAIWKALLPQIPKHLLLGRGYSFSAETFSDSMGADATFKNSIDASQNALALSSDFHNGPISVVLSFGIWGVWIWLWFWAAGFYVVWRNYHYGDPAIRHINLFLFASFISKVFAFLFIFGDIVGDTGAFAGVVGLSIALNHGVMGRQAAKAEIAKAESKNVQQLKPGRNWELKPSRS